jgi:hypothetical protein
MAIIQKIIEPKFGHMLDMKVDFSFEIWRIWAKFSMKNPLVRSKSNFAGQNLAKISNKQKYCMEDVVI